jgi:hypothetical protein
MPPSVRKSIPPGGLWVLYAMPQGRVRRRGRRAPCSPVCASGARPQFVEISSGLLDWFCHRYTKHVYRNSILICPQDHTTDRTSNSRTSDTAPATHARRGQRGRLPCRARHTPSPIARPTSWPSAGGAAAPGHHAPGTRGLYTKYRRNSYPQTPLHHQRLPSISPSRIRVSPTVPAPPKQDRHPHATRERPPLPR